MGKSRKFISFLCTLFVMITKPLPEANSQEPDSPTPRLFILGAILVFSPALIHFYFIYVYTTNIPFSDDFSSLKEVMEILHAETLRGKIALLFAHQNEHVLALTRAIFMLVYFISDSIDFKILVIIANFALLGLLFIFYKALPEKQERVFLLLPASLLLFQLKQNWVHMIWAMEALETLYGLCFSGLTFYFLGKNSNKYVCLAFFFALVTVITHGSGMATLVAGWAILLLQKKFRTASVWLIGSIIIVVIYFNNMHFVARSSIVPTSLDDLLRIGTFFVSFVGAIASFELENKMPLFGLGSLIIFYFIFLVRKKYYAINPAVFGFMVYLLLVAALVAISRSGVGENLVFSNRYKIFSLTMFVLVYISVVDLFYPKVNRKWIFLAGMILVAGSMYLVSYGGGKKKLEFAQYTQVYRINQWLDKNYSLYDESEGKTNRVMTEALTGGFYKVPYQLTGIPEKKYSELVNSEDLCVRESEKPFENEFNVIVAGPEAAPFLVRIEGMIYGSESEPPAESEPVHVILRSREGNYLFTSHPHKRTRSSIHFRKERSNTGLIALIPINRLSNNTYQIGLCYRGGVVYSNQVIIKQGHLVKVVR